MDIDFSLQDIPVQESQLQGPFYTMQLSLEAAFKDEEGEAYRAVTAPPPQWRGSGGGVASRGRRCDAGLRCAARALHSVHRSLGTSWRGPLRRLSPLAQQEIEHQMEAVAPQVELTMEAFVP